jgi:23S rRNA pseudouridine2605 synthase
MAPERLQKVLAAAGVASRRKSEVLIGAGRVTVDGRVAGLGTTVEPGKVTIEVDGVPIGGEAAHIYLALHKPAGVTSTVRDRHAQSTVLDLVPTSFMPDGGRLYPVGRLDRDSEGLLFLTNDGAWSQHVSHPRHGVDREYAVGLPQAIEPAQQERLAAGVELEEGLAELATPLRPETAVETRRLVGLILPPADPAIRWYRATIRQGWKRQLRRMFGAIGIPVIRLVRVRIGPVRLDDLASGRIRRLKAPEIRMLGGAAPAPIGRRRRRR